MEVSPASHVEAVSVGPSSAIWVLFASSVWRQNLCCTQDARSAQAAVYLCAHLTCFWCPCHKLRHIARNFVYSSTIEAFRRHVM